MSKKYVRPISGLIAVVMVLMILSGCVTTVSEAKVSLLTDNQHKLSVNEQVYLRYSDGEVITKELSVDGNTYNAVYTTNANKSLIGAYVHDSISHVSWVPDYSYPDSTLQFNLTNSNIVRPHKAAVIAEQVGPVVNADINGYVSVTYAVYDGAGADGHKVGDRIEVFVHGNSNLAIRDNDPLGFPFDASEGISYFTENGQISFTIKSTVQEFASIPLELYSGPTLIYESEQTKLNKLVKTLNAQFAAGDSADNVKHNLVLPDAAPTGTTVTWESSDSSTISTSGAIHRQETDKQVTLTVRAANGDLTASRSLQVTVKGASSNAELKSLNLSIGTLDPEFDKETPNYTAEVGHDVARVSVTASVSDTKSRITIDGSPADSGDPSDSIPLAEGPNTIPIVVTAENGATNTYTVVVTRATAPVVSPEPSTPPVSPEPSTPVASPDPSTPPTTSVPSPVPTPAPAVHVTGIAGSAKVTNEIIGGQESTKVTLSANNLTNLFSADSSGIAIIEVTGGKPSTQIELPWSGLAAAADKNPNAIVQIKVDGASYSLPVSVLKNAPADAVVSLTIAQVSGKVSEEIQAAAKVKGSQSISRGPVDYTLSVNGKEWTDLNGTYADRTMILNTAADAGKSTAVWVDINRILHFVPSVFAGTHATIRSPHNSIYTVIQSDKSFTDLQNHWARTDIEILANKLIVTGVTDKQFAPDKNITRAEFTALLVRALGLVDDTAATKAYSDVSASVWYAGAVGAAQKASLIGGYEDNTFRPDASITREQMVSMIGRAMKFAGHTGQADTAVLAKFKDRSAIAEWATEAAAVALSAHIIEGVNDQTFAPKDKATRAQSAVMLKRMLQDLHFIN